MGGARVRAAGPADADVLGRLLHDYNREYDLPCPPPEEIAVRMRELLHGTDTAALLADEDAGLAVLRFRPSLWSPALECYLAELYVIPERRSEGVGRALMEAAIALARARGADHMDLGTSEDDVAARRLYESMGFTNREGRPDGPIMYFYERKL